MAYCIKYFKLSWILL